MSHSLLYALQLCRDLWKIIRTNPDLFNDVISDVTTTNFDIGASSSLEQKRQRAIAGGYIRTIAVRLIFLEYIDTRCSKGCPPTIHDGRDDNKAHSPSPKELVFGLKVLSKGGRAILQHGKNARDSHDTLSLAISCFNVLSRMTQSNGEAANELKDVLLDEAFDVYSALPNAAALFEEEPHVDMAMKDDDASTQAHSSGVNWPTIVLQHLEAAKSFIDEHCNDALNNESKSPLKYAALQRFLPQLARLCFKHGHHFAELGMNDHAMTAFNIDLTATDSCLCYIETEKGRTHQKKNETQMLHNLEADIVVLSIESLYVLSAALQSSGRKEDALGCLDQVETYMNKKHERDVELHGNTMSDLGSGNDFIFSEDPIGPAKDKADIKNRSQIALAKSRRIHSREKAILASRKVQLFNDNPSKDDEQCIDDQLRSMVELVSKKAESTLVDTSGYKDETQKLALQAIRIVYVRRKMTSMTNGGSEALGRDPYRLMFDKLAKSHQLRPFVVLDKLNATVNVAYEVRHKELEPEYHSIDQEAILLAEEYLSSFKRDNKVTSDTTLFVDAKNSMKMELLKEAEDVFTRAVSHYYSWEAYEMCAKWANMLKDIHETSNASREHGENPVLAAVLSVLGYSLSMSGNHAEGMKMAREAWKYHKGVNNLATLFHCAAKHKHADALLEFDNALNELSTSDHDDILEHFPRFSNSCVVNEADGGGELLLGVQERWLNLQLRSKKLSESLEQKQACETPSGHSVLDLLCAYLENFEHVTSSQKDKQKAESMCEYLGHIIDGVLRLLQVCRDRKEDSLTGKRRKKNASNESDSSEDLDLIWNDSATQTLLGSRSQCLWCAEALWNIGQQLVAASVVDDVTYDSRALAADLFAASHDFVLMSEEEEGTRLGKLDYDVKYEPEKYVVPSFNGTSTIAVSDTSSEFSAQCLLLSAAVTVDYLGSAGHDSSSAKSLLRRTLHRLAQSQQEFELNDRKKSHVSKVIALLTMRCIIELEEDSFSFQTFNDGLCATLLKLHTNEAATSDEKFDILKQVKIMSDSALRRRMTHTDRILTKLCSDMLQKSSVSMVGGISLGDLQQKLIKTSSSVEEVIGVFNEVENVMKKEGTSYSPEDFGWFTTEAHNRAVQLSTVGDDARAKICSTFALNFIEFSTKEVRCHKNLIVSGFTNSVQKLSPLDFTKSL
eukprot:scaffold11957_cov146-Skeletonema_menzelii.AAC.2